METFITTIGEATVEVEFDYSPEERQTWTDPGCDEQVDITSIKHQGKEIDVNDKACEQLVDEALEHITASIEEAQLEHSLSMIEEY